MSAAELIVRLALAAVFAVAGVAKLRDLPGSRAAVVGFGVQGPAARLLGTLLPMAELAIALALVHPATARVAAAGAFALLLVFAAAIGRSLARGEQPECNCFGQLHSAPIGGRTLARNLVLAGAAAFVVARPEPISPVGWLGDLDGTELALVIVSTVGALALALQTRFILAVLRQNGRILRRLAALEAGASTAAGHGAGASIAAGGQAGASTAAGQEAASPAARIERGASGLPVGAAAPHFELAGVDRPAVLVFSDPDCGPCKALMPDVRRWQRKHAEALTITVVADRELALAYDCPATPTAVLVGVDGRIAAAAAEGPDAIRSLIKRSTNGAASPSLDLHDLDGEPIDLADPRAGTRMLLFWDPACGFCGRMLDDLRAVEAARPQHAPELVVISTGSAEVNRAQGFTSQVVLDPDFAAGRAFGAGGTPSAILADGRGRPLSALAVGGPDVLKMARV